MSTRILQRWTICSVALVGVVAAVVSFCHMQTLAELHGESWRSVLIPLAVDGMLVAATLAIVSQRRHRRPAGWVPWLGLTLGILASLAANVAAARPELIAQLIAAWPPVALAVSIETLVVVLRSSGGSPDRNGSDMEVPAGALAPRISRSAGGSTQSAEAQSDSEHRPDRLTDPDEEPAGPAASRAPERHPTPTRDLGGKTPSPDIHRPGRTVSVMAGSTAPDAAQGHTTPTRPIAAQTPEPGVDQPGRERDLEPAGPPTRGVSTSAANDTDGRNPVAELIEAGAGRRRIAAELGVTEYRARKLQEASKNGDGR